MIDRTVATCTSTWPALGTTALVRVADAGRLTQARQTVEHQLAAIDAACSRFDANSELSRLNASGGSPRRVSPLLAQAIAVALRAAELTDGLVDPTIGRAVAAAGYDRDWRLLSVPGASSLPLATGGPAAPRMRATRAAAGWRSVRLDRDRCEVMLPKGIELDLGATAKAWAADLCAVAAAASTGVGVLISLGGDIRIAGEAPRAGWLVHVTDDHRSRPTAPGQTIALRCGGLATSSTTVRRWAQDGVVMHHLIDPDTGAPARSVWRTASVCAADCVDANIASTASMLLSERAPEWLSSRGLPARLLAADGSVLTVGDWPRQSGAAARTAAPVHGAPCAAACSSGDGRSRAA